MSLSKCPRCDEDVSVPPATAALLRSHPDALMRCPRCGEDSALSRLSVPPSIDIVDRNGMSLLNDAADQFGSIGPGRPYYAADGGPHYAAGDVIDEGLDFTNVPVNDEEDSDELVLRPAVGSDRPAATATAPMNLKTGPARGRTSTPMWKTLLGVAAGPPIAAVVGYFILSAAGRVPDLGFWPFIGENAPRPVRTAAAPPRSVAAAQRPETLSMPSIDDGPIDDGPIEMTMPGDDPDPTDQPPNSMAELTAMETAASDVPNDPAPVADDIPETVTEVDLFDPPAIDPTVAPENPESLRSDIDQAIGLIGSFEGKPLPQLKEPVTAGFSLLSRIAGQTPSPSDQTERLVTTINDWSGRRLLSRLSPLLMTDVLATGDGLFLVGESNGDATLTLIDGRRFEIDSAEPVPTGPVMVFAKVDSPVDPQILTASIVAAMKP